MRGFIGTSSGGMGKRRGFWRRSPYVHHPAEPVDSSTALRIVGGRLAADDSMIVNGRLTVDESMIVNGRLIADG